MAGDCGYAIVWLDAHIGGKDNNRILKKEFEVGVVEVGAVPPVPYDPIDDLLCAVREYSAPIEFTDDQEEALKLIKDNLKLGKEVLLISSASLGKLIIPVIEEKKLKIKSYYIFCANMDDHLSWLNDCVNEGLDMMMFNHHTSLLIRLCRDTSKILTEDGKNLLNKKNPRTALRYFEFAFALANKAFEHDKPLNESDKHHPSTVYRPILNSLMEQARQAIAEESTT